MAAVQASLQFGWLLSICVALGCTRWIHCLADEGGWALMAVRVLITCWRSFPPWARHWLCWFVMPPVLLIVWIVQTWPDQGLIEGDVLDLAACEHINDRFLSNNNDHSYYIKLWCKYNLLYITVIKLNRSSQDIPGVPQCSRNYSVPQHAIVGNLVQSEV